jgi:hypothetical protein
MNDYASTVPRPCMSVVVRATINSSSKFRHGVDNNGDNCARILVYTIPGSNRDIKY